MSDQSGAKRPARPADATAQPPPSKRSKAEATDAGAASLPSSSLPGPPTVEGAAAAPGHQGVFGIGVGDVLEVSWDLDDDDASDGTPNESVWWACRYAGPTGRVHRLEDGDEEKDMPLHTLDYDPLPARGFPDRCPSDVVFVSEHWLYDIAYDGLLVWRRKGSTFEPAARDPGACDGAAEVQVRVPGSRDALTEIVQAAMAPALAKLMPRMDALDADVAYRVADRVAAAREKMVDKLVQHSKSSPDAVFDAAAVRGMVQAIGEEMQQERTAGLVGAGGSSVGGGAGAAGGGMR